MPPVFEAIDDLNQFRGFGFKKRGSGKWAVVADHPDGYEVMDGFFDTCEEAQDAISQALRKRGEDVVDMNDLAGGDDA